MSPDSAPANPDPALPMAVPDLATVVHRLVNSRPVAWSVLGGLPALGLAATLVAGLPLFAGLMAGTLLLAAALTCRLALLSLVGQALRVLVAARLVIVLVVGALLFGTAGGAWVVVVSALLLWLTTDRLLGRQALADLWRLCRGQP